MSDIDKDIDNIKELIKNANTEDADMNNCFGGEHILSIENVLAEIKLLKSERVNIFEKLDIVHKYEEKLEQKDKELEIKDKMIDLMADYMWKNLYDAEKMYICNGFTSKMDTCVCMSEEEHKCKEKIKEQFRNEVLKDE